MGCDIHLYLEVFKNSKWEGVPSNRKKGWQGYPHSNKKAPRWSWYFGRDYWAFSILADVRNGDRAVVPISGPRGVPEDIATSTRDEYCLIVDDLKEEVVWKEGKIVKREMQHVQGHTDMKSALSYVKGGSEWFDELRITDPDAHSGSYFSLEELLEAQKTFDALMPFEGHVNLEQYKLFKENGDPEDFISATNYVTGEVVTNEQMDQEIIDREHVLSEFGPKCDKHTFIQFQRSIKYYTKRIDQLINILKGIAKKEKLSNSDVRIVFWFDN